MEHRDHAMVMDDLVYTLNVKVGDEKLQYLSVVN